MPNQPKRKVARQSQQLRYDTNGRQRGLNWEHISEGRLPNPFDAAVDSTPLDEPVKTRRKKTR